MAKKFNFSSLDSRLNKLEKKPEIIPTQKEEKPEIQKESKPEVEKKEKIPKRTYTKKTPGLKLLVDRIEKLEKEAEKQNEMYSYVGDISLQTIKDYLYEKYNLKEFDRYVNINHFFWDAKNYNIKNPQTPEEKRIAKIFKSVETMRVARLLNRFERGDGAKYTFVLDIIRSELTKILKK